MISTKQQREWAYAQIATALKAQSEMLYEEGADQDDLAVFDEFVRRVNRFLVLEEARRRKVTAPFGPANTR
jgi:hypothetical protein